MGVNTFFKRPEMADTITQGAVGEPSRCQTTAPKPLETKLTAMSEAVDLPEEHRAMREQLIAWYKEDHRSFPWRKTTDPYAILVCEVMSQQTQLERVQPAYEAFLERWPTAADLAAAEQGDVVAFWSDHRLGYNNRVKYLHEAATLLTEEYEAFPQDPEELTDLPGVGPYTANALSSFAFNTGDAVVDTNVKRVLFRVFQGDHEDEPPYEELANDLMPNGASRTWNNAIMELGGVACEKTPACDTAACPWRPWCDAYETGDFTAPDVPTQPSFEGSRRQFRGRVIRTLSETGELPLAELGPKIRVDYSVDTRSWLVGLIADLEEEGLVSVEGALDQDEAVKTETVTVELAR